MTPKAPAIFPQSQTIVVVNGTTELHGVLDALLGPGEYVVLLADSTSQAYTLIRRVKPHLVLLGLGLDDPVGYQLLSMLKLDPTTRRTRIVTCMPADEPEEPSNTLAEAITDALYARPVGQMN
jgi:CheY-like chemotaxis protein